MNPSPWGPAAPYGIYTLSPTHVGSGRAAGAVDLPVVRDSVTGHPLLPASALKGVLRARLSSGAEEPDQWIRDCFGPTLDDREGDDQPGLRAGTLVLTEARLAAWPVRSLQRPFLHLTCPLVIDQIRRQFQLLTPDHPLAAWTPPQGWGEERFLCADRGLHHRPLVLEDWAAPAEAVEASDRTQDLAALLADAVGGGAPLEATRERLRQGLVVAPDQVFSELVTTSIQVVARTQLTSDKTTTGKDDGEKGNLWYEERVPPETLFLGHIGERRRAGPRCLDSLRSRLAGAIVQIGGNETLGQGLCQWTLGPGEEGS